MAFTRVLIQVSAPLVRYLKLYINVPTFAKLGPMLGSVLGLLIDGVIMKINIFLQRTR